MQDETTNKGAEMPETSPENNFTADNSLLKQLNPKRKTEPEPDINRTEHGFVRRPGNSVFCCTWL